MSIATKKLLFGISKTAIDIAAIGRIVRDMAEDNPFVGEETSDQLTRLSALGECIGKLGQEIINQIDDLPLSEQ